VSRQAYYKGVKQGEKEAVQQELIIELVQQIRRKNQKMGGKKLYHLLQADIHRIDASMGRDKFFDLLRKWKLLVPRRRKYAVTTQSQHWYRVYKNKLKDIVIERPHQVWVCDITYIRTGEGFVYLFLITDAYSRKIIGWELSKSLGLEGALGALRMAIGQCPATRGLTHHSDRGFQYCSHEYVRRLKVKGIEISMTEAGNCYENAIAERVNGILKEEYGLDETFADHRQAMQAAREGIKAYNEQRPHWSLGLQIPARVHKAVL
jgi:transposase InsO family protein